MSDSSFASRALLPGMDDESRDERTAGGCACRKCNTYIDYDVAKLRLIETSRGRKQYLQRVTWKLSPCQPPDWKWYILAYIAVVQQQIPVSYEGIIDEEATIAPIHHWAAIMATRRVAVRQRIQWQRIQWMKRYWTTETAIRQRFVVNKRRWG